MKARGAICCSVLLLTTVMGCRGSRGPAVYVPSRAGMESSFGGISSKRVLEAAMQYPKAALEQVAEVPVSLTSSDGTGLNLVSLAGKAVVQGPLAFTELQLGFRNPEDRVIEGRFTITLPPRAAISRFAMKIGETWQEAEVVERKAAQQIYEDFLHRKQDPALLEKKAGNQFSARVFPIPARAIKELIISYSQQLVSAEQPYRLYLKGLPRIESLEITAMIGEQAVKQQASSLGGELLTHKVLRLQKRDFAPDRDFEVPVASSTAGLTHRNLALLRVQPRLPSQKAPLESLLVLVDTSASRAAGFYQQVALLGAMVEELKKTYGGDPPLLVACFDQVVDSVYQGRLGDFGKADLDAILVRRPLGASNLQRALGWAAQVRGFRRLLLISDGIATAGETEGDALVSALKELGGQVQRADVLLSGGIREEGIMRSLVSGALEQDGMLLDGDEPAARLADRLSRRTVSGVKVTVPGARFVWPQRLDSLQAGDHALVFAQLPEGQSFPAGRVSVELSGPISDRHTASLAAASGPLLERAWVEARIAHLEQQRDRGTLDVDLRSAVAKQIVEISVKHRVLSDLTALLVLETENDYARYNIPRTALADILVVGPGGVELQQRQQQPVLVPRQEGRTDVDGERFRRPPPVPTPAPVPEAAPAQGLPARSSEDAPQSSAPPPAPARRRPTVEPKVEPKVEPRVRPIIPRPLEAAKATDDVSSQDRAQASEAPAPERSDRSPERSERSSGRVMEREREKNRTPALSGRLAEIMDKLQGGRIEDALVQALRWRAEEPGDVLALVGLGEALQANGNRVLAARVYGSIIDLFPSRADMLRFAGERLEVLGKPGLELAENAYRLAVSQRPDHVSGHRLLAMALARQGKLEPALAALEAGLKQSYRIERSGTRRILLEDLGLIAAALLARSPDRRGELEQRLQALGGHIADKPSLRFVINWETDANDVDFHIEDGQGGHAYYSARSLPSGGELYADVTNGYGPECFTVEGTPTAYPYKLQAHYYSKGPMGYGMGKLQILQHDGRGGLQFEDRAFVVMTDGAFVDLGIVKGDL